MGVLNIDSLVDGITLENLESYLKRNLLAFKNDERSCDSTRDPSAITEHIYAKLTHRTYCYLSKTKAARYKSAVLAYIRNDIDKSRPIQFYYDLGPGYHASIDIEGRPLYFDVGLAEIMALRQISLFCQEIRSIYSPGASFCIVIDNLCALFTNDISLNETDVFVKKLRNLIHELECQDYISVLVESEKTSKEEYSEIFDETEDFSDCFSLSDGDVENVSRFLGRACGRDEAAQRIGRYRKAGEVTERLLKQFIDGVRLTQRATRNTLGFRAFPGGDQRIQAGQLVLKMNATGKVQVGLVTSKNYRNHQLYELKFPNILPASVPLVYYAKVTNGEGASNR